MRRKIRKAIVSIVTNIGQTIFLWFAKRNTIVFESKPSFSDNTFVLYKELLRQGYNTKYKMIWFVDEQCLIPDLPMNVTCFVLKNTIANLFIRYYYLQTASFVISCNSRFYSTRKGHNNIHLGHGSPLKDPGTNVFLNEYFDCVTIQAQQFKKKASEVYNVPMSKVIVTGYPRTDLLLAAYSEIKAQTVREGFKKVIVWLPTFRTSRGRIDSSKYMPFGIPVLTSKSELNRINNILIQNDSLLIIKIHFAQDSQRLLQYSNIRMIDNSYLNDRGLQLYEFLKYTDGLITDYSSVYYEYLLLQKPIGLTVDDINEYTENRGLAVGDYFSDIPGEYIYNFEDLYCFIESLCEGNIKFGETMIAAEYKYNDFFDGCSASRVVDYLKAEHNL